MSRLRRYLIRLTQILNRRSKNSQDSQHSQRSTTQHQPSEQKQTRIFMANLDVLRRTEDALSESRITNERVAAILHATPPLPCVIGAVRRPICLQCPPVPPSKVERKCLTRMRDWNWESGKRRERVSHVQSPAMSPRGSMRHDEIREVEALRVEVRPGAEKSENSSVLPVPVFRLPESNSSGSNMSVPSNRSSRFLEHLSEDDETARK